MWSEPRSVSKKQVGNEDAINKGSGNGSCRFWVASGHLHPHGHPCSVTLGSMEPLCASVPRLP